MAKKPPVQPYAGYLSPAQRLALARQEAQAGLLPSLQANARARQQAIEDARNQAAAAKSAYAALAQIQAGIAPQIGNTYGQAADRQAAYGRGFSGSVGATLDQSAAAANALLAKNGSPQQIASQGQSARDVLYGLGGYSPASVLNAQGSAFESAARNLPAQSVGLGVDASKAAALKGQDSVKQLLGRLMDLNAQRPGLVSRAMAGINDQQSNAYAQAIQAEYLRNTLRTSEAGLLGVDPVTGRPTVAAAGAAAGAKGKKAEARAKAIARRNDAMVTALDEAQTYVENWAVKQHTKLVRGTEPLQIGMDPPVRNADGKIVAEAQPIYAKKGGGVTRNIAEAETKYEPVPIPKPAYKQIRGRVLGDLRRKLKRFGYKEAELQAMALEILDDYYSPQEINPPKRKPTVKVKANGVPSNADVNPRTNPAAQGPPAPRRGP